MKGKGGETMTISCEEEQKMYAITEYRKLDLSKLKNRKRKIMSTEDSLHDIVPIQWYNDAGQILYFAFNKNS